MAGISIPGVTDKYNTNDTVEKLMKVERIPLTREQKQLETYKTEKDAWREINSRLTALRDSSKALYSFENPFNSKLTTSTQENAVTAQANRSADIQTFKIDVIQPASSDRFLTGELDNDFKVPAGTYIYKVGEKQVVFNWKGGSLKDFSNGINKRGNNIIKSSIIGGSAGKKSLLIEAVPTGKENRLVFEEDARKFAFDSGMIAKITPEGTVFGTTQDEILPAQKIEYDEPDYMPALSLTGTKAGEDGISAQPRSAYQVQIPGSIASDTNQVITLTIQAEKTDDITAEINRSLLQPEIPDAGFAEFGGIVVSNSDSDTTLDLPPTPPEPLNPIESSNVIFAVMEDGSERPVKTPDILDGAEKEVHIPLKDFQGIKALAIRNVNTGNIIRISALTSSDPAKGLGYGPQHPVSEADDAIIKYEGITISRPSNKIDDVVPEVTLDILDKTERTATITIKPDTESSKDAIINFVGQYNQALAEINILSQNKPEIIEELDYLTADERKTEQERLGLFSSDFSLTSIKNSMQSIVAAGYSFSDSAAVTMLSQIGIATNAGGFSGGYSQSKLRGYLEIDEKKLDEALLNNMDDIRQMFGYDSDGDLIVDSGIAYKLDRQISAYTQTGGIIASKTSSIDSKIKTTESRIAKLEAQMDDKEAELRNKYAQMEGTLGSLESQQTTISNFTKQQQK